LFQIIIVCQLPTESSICTNQSYSQASEKGAVT